MRWDSTDFRLSSSRSSRMRSPRRGLAAVVWPPLPEVGHDLLGEEPQTPFDRLGREERFGIQLGGEAGQPEHLLELEQTVGDLFRRAEDHLGLENLVVGELLQLLDPLPSPLLVLGPDTRPEPLVEAAGEAL